MKTLAIAIALATLAGCMQMKETSAGGATTTSDGRPDWLRDPARGEYPYNAKGW